MDIKTIQLTFAEILKDKYIPKDDDDIYIKKIIASKNLRILKDIIFFWRANEIESYCFLTATLLKKLNVFDEKVKKYYTENDFSNYIEELGKSFLRFLKNDSNELIKFSAEFEFAMTDVKSGSDTVYMIESFYHPNKIFNFILDDGAEPLHRDSKKYLIKVSKNIENNFSLIN